MKAVVLTRAFDPSTGTPGAVAYVERPKPQVQADDDVLVRIAYASLCGSDKHYLNDNLFGFETDVPLGHEWSGVIEDLGPAAREAGFAEGDRVTGDFVLECGTCFNCRTGKPQFCDAPRVTMGMQAEYTLLKAAQLYHVPDDVPLDVAALAEPFAIAVSAVMKAGVGPGKSVFVVGAGSIGQMLVQLARLSGASVVGTSARTSAKRELACAMGADFALDPNERNVVEAALDATDGRGFDIVFEASGNVGCVTDAVNMATCGGTVLLVSYYDPEAQVPLNVFKQLVMREVSVGGMQIGQRGWPYAVDLLRRVNLRPLISKVYDLEDAHAAYEEHLAGKGLKILLRCSGE